MKTLILLISSGLRIERAEDEANEEERRKERKRNEIMTQEDRKKIAGNLIQIIKRIVE